MPDLSTSEMGKYRVAEVPAEIEPLIFLSISFFPGILFQTRGGFVIIILDGKTVGNARRGDDLFKHPEPVGRFQDIGVAGIGYDI